MGLSAIFYQTLNPNNKAQAKLPRTKAWKSKAMQKD